MVIPKIKITILAGRRTLCAIKLSSISGDAAFLSMITNKANDPIDKKANETTVICVDESSLLLFPMYVSASKKEAIVTAKAMAPFRSILRVLFAEAFGCFEEYFALAGCSKLIEVSNSALLSWIDLFITIQRIMATGTMKRKVACHPKFLIIVPPTAKPTTDPAANIELNTPTPTASLSLGS